MSTPPFGLHPNVSASNATLPPYASTPLLASPFHPSPEGIRHGGPDFGTPNALDLQSTAPSSLGAYQDTPDLAANREVLRRPSTYRIPIPEVIHRGAAHRASADNVPHEMHAISSSSSRGQGAFAGESRNTRTGPASAMGGRESTVSAGSAMHEHNPFQARISAAPYVPSPAFSRSLPGSSQFGREIFARTPAHSTHDQPGPASGWPTQRALESTTSITPPDLYATTHPFRREITSSESPEGGHVLTAAPGSDSSGTPSARAIPTSANPPRNWEDGYALQSVIERDGMVANDGFGGVVTLVEPLSSFTHSQADIQCGPGPFDENSFIESPPSWNTPSSERVQIGRRNAALDPSSLLPPFLAGPNLSTSTDVSPGGGFGTNVRVSEDFRYATTRQIPSQNFRRLTLPTPVPFGQNPSSNPLPRRTHSSSSSSAGYLSGPASTPPILSTATPTIASPPEPATRPSVLVLGARAPVSSPAQSSQKSSSAVRPPRKKTHGCWMCNKSFDRPSTLKKHLLVHTGEKAFVCQFCTRRFGVASNLNRHIKRCPQRPKDASALAGPSSSSTSTRVTSTNPASTIFTLNLGLRTQLPYSDSSPFDLAPSSSATTSTLNLYGGPLPSSSSTPSYYVYPGSEAQMARSSHLPESSDSTHVPARSARGESARSSRRASATRLSESAPDQPPALDESSLPSRRPRSNSRSPARASGEHSRSDSGNVSFAESGTSPSSETAHQQSEKPRKRPRRPPSPSTWVPESLANFEMYPAPALTRAAPCPLPPVKPIYDSYTNTMIEERDSFASTLAATLPPGTSDDESSSSSESLNDGNDARVGSGNDENADPGSGSAFNASSRARERALTRENRAAAKEARRRARLALYYSYHDIGWTGTLPGPAVVLGTGPEGDAVIERAPVGVGSSSGAGLSGSMVGADMTNLRFEVITGEPSEGASGSSSRGMAP
ncbi:hypothetical protein SCHPADRAFT_48462 [Schizopora paradoxa]|uniref:C2H2-type domain-containing protein n=1 Tax=Schizopora paradoxa TaxID=27342 RepID=A0A0H2S6Y0_9AGAM|nr:hypothetical protein SCHPADRAFT_48462 [Schizopora paradoxa]